ncbi:MFS transporter [Virgibacillus oceani]|uniref:MFS transporter n=1 Tax=Virgibacillus oceani TaxID=1479511 RepID=A0A917HCL0_9BACI|nr:MFS transporter [Virgibacillus oceani]GGG75013.1 MFS transporter [Virgibacillus oceani]
MEAAQSNTVNEAKVPVFKNRNFLFLIIAALFSSPGYYVYLIGAEWLMLSITENRFYFGMLFLAASIPRLLLLTAGGLIADRFNRRTILFLSDLSRALLIIVLLFFILTDSVTAVHLIVLAMLFGISDAFSYPAMNSMTPMILAEDQLQRGNSLIQMTAQISPILGPAVGGSLIAFLGFEGVFTVAFIMLLLSSLAVLFIRLPDQPVANEKKTPWEDLKEGFSYARKNELVIAVVILGFFLNFFISGPLSIGLPIIIKDIFQGSALNLASVEISMGIGALAGAIVLASIRLKKQGLVLLISLILLGIFYASIGMSANLLLVVMLVATMGFLIQLVNIPLMTMLQQTTEKRMLGRMMSFLMTVSTGLVPVSYVVTSLLLAMGVGIQVIIMVGGIIVTLIAAINFRNKHILSFKEQKG